MIIDQQFIRQLHADPSGERKTSPTIFDEMRWATQHSQKPLEQVVQLISELHGPWTGMNATAANLLTSLLSMFKNKANKTTLSQIKQALSAINNINIPSSIGRLNNINASSMAIPLLRAFISKSQAIHPSVNSYIQNNIGKYPYFQQISEQVGSLGQATLSHVDIHPINRVITGGNTSMKSNYPVRRNTDRKVFDEISTTIDTADSFVNTLFLRAMKPEGNNAILLDSNNSSVSHGYSYTMDVKNAPRIKNTVAPCLASAVQRFGPTVQLLDSYCPVEYRTKVEPQYFEIMTENGVSYVDKLNRPITRQVHTPVASEEAIIQTS